MTQNPQGNDDSDPFKDSFYIIQDQNICDIWCPCKKNQFTISTTKKGEDCFVNNQWIVKEESNYCINFLFCQYRTMKLNFQQNKTQIKKNENLENENQIKQNENQKNENQIKQNENQKNENQIKYVAERPKIVYPCSEIMMTIKKYVGADQYEIIGEISAVPQEFQIQCEDKGIYEKLFLKITLRGQNNNQNGQQNNNQNVQQNNNQNGQQNNNQNVQQNNNQNVQQNNNQNVQQNNNQKVQQNVNQNVQQNVNQNVQQNNNQNVQQNVNQNDEQIFVISIKKPSLLHYYLRQCCLPHCDIIYSIYQFDEQNAIYKNIGQITNKFQGCYKEYCTRGDEFQITFFDQKDLNVDKKNLNVDQKALLMFGCLQLNYQEYEQMINFP